jgi:hypothetical protein
VEKETTPRSKKDGESNTKQLDNSIAVVYTKKEKKDRTNNPKTQQIISAEMEIQRLQHLVNTTKQHLALMQQKNAQHLMGIVQPTLAKRNLQVVVFDSAKR